MSCSADEDYMGCYSMENFVASSQFSLNTTVNCKLKCLKENARFFGEYSKKDNSKNTSTWIPWHNMKYIQIQPRETDLIIEYFS